MSLLIRQYVVVVCDGVVFVWEDGGDWFGLMGGLLI